MLSLIGMIAIGLGVASVVFMAIPILKPKPILISSKALSDFGEDLKRSIIREVPVFLGFHALERAISKFNTELWNAFVE